MYFDTPEDEITKYCLEAYLKITSAHAIYDVLFLVYSKVHEYLLLLWKDSKLESNVDGHFIRFNWRNYSYFMYAKISVLVALNKTIKLAQF